jgi:uncharacterized protein YdiU (UPF0061 family)
VLRSLADYAVARHAPEAAATDNSALTLFDHVVAAQASLIAQWMEVGFVHGVMNTDNMTISGETIDYGPCAFMEAYDPATVFSSIDHGGRYAYGNQPAIATWNLARLAEAMLPLFDDDADTAVSLATEVLGTFPDRFRAAWSTAMRSKLGLDPADTEGDALVASLLELMQANAVDYTAGLRSLSGLVAADGERAAADRFGDGVDAWAADWRPRVVATPDELDRRNPLFIPRNHLVEEALAAATAGDLDPFRELLAVVADPFTARPGLDRYTRPAPPEVAACHRTFCGT